MPDVTPVQTLDDILEFIPVSWYHYRLFLMCGLSFMADAMEVSLLAFISKCAGSEWGLNNEEKAFVVSVVFIGEMVGSIVWGPVADHFGRKIAFLIVSLTISLGGFAAAFSPNYTFLLLFLGIVGFGVGGLTVPFDLLAEFLPSSHRGRALLYINYFWTGGSMFVNGTAWIILSKYGWRALTLITAVPVALSTILSIIYLPESPRWLLEEGRIDEAEKVLKEVASMNNAPLSPFRLAVDENEFDSSGKPLNKGANYVDLVRTPKMRWISLPLWAVWLLFGFCYYGIILFVTRVYSKPNPDGSESCSFDYEDVFINSIAEFVGVFLAVLVIDNLGRVRLQALSYVVGGIAAGLLGFNLPAAALLGVGMLGRLSTMAGVATTWVATPELYTTRYRATAHAACGGITRVGGFFAPLFVMSSASDKLVGGVLGMFGCLAAVCACLLPETLGMDIDDISKLTAETPADIDDDDFGSVDRSHHDLLGSSDTAKRTQSTDTESINVVREDGGDEEDGLGLSDGSPKSVLERLSITKDVKPDEYKLLPTAGKFDSNSIN